MIAALLGPAAALAAESPPARADAPALAHKEAPVPKNPPSPKAPTAELLDWLGRYADAGDGLDPLGLADLEAAPPMPETKDRRQ